MPRRWIAIAAVATALVAGGAVALAAPGGPFGGGMREQQSQFARELAANLPGVTAAQVEQALRKVHERRAAAFRAQLARDLAPRLHVSVGQVAAALDKAHQQLEQSRGNGGPPQPGLFVQTLASKLGKSEPEVRQALQAARRARLEQRLDEAVRTGRLTRAQADRIRQRLEQGGGRFGMRIPLGEPGPGGPAHDEVVRAPEGAEPG